MVYMTRIAYKSSYRSLVELRRAYERLGLSQTTDAREATLLIDEGLSLRWACRTLDSSYEYGEWHIIADAGELDYPPLRPEEEIWAALLERHPVPDDEHTRHTAQLLGLSQTTDAREATLLIDEGLSLRWACRTLDSSYEYGEWHIIADAGELDYPPLRPEEEIWAALLERHPVPDDEHTRHTAQLLGK